MNLSVVRVLTLTSAQRSRVICSGHRVRLRLWLAPCLPPHNIGSSSPKGTHSLTGTLAHEPEKCQIDVVTIVTKPAKSRVRSVRFGEHKYPASMRQRWHRYPADSLPASCYSQVIGHPNLGSQWPVPHHPCHSAQLHWLPHDTQPSSHPESPVTHSYHLPVKGS